MRIEKSDDFGESDEGLASCVGDVFEANRGATIFRCGGIDIPGNVVGGRVSKYLSGGCQRNDLLIPVSDERVVRGVDAGDELVEGCCETDGEP